MVFQCINIRQVPWELLKTAAFNIRQFPWEVLKTAAFGLGFQHLPRDLANVNAWKTMFDRYNETDLSSRPFSQPTLWDNRPTSAVSALIIYTHVHRRVFYTELTASILTDSADPDKIRATSDAVAFDQGIHCLPLAQQFQNALKAPYS